MDLIRLVELAACLGDGCDEQLLPVGLDRGNWLAGALPEYGTEAVLSALFSEIDDDPEVRADQVLTKALRRVPLEELCGVGNDLTRLERPAVASAVERSDRIREEAGA